MVGDAAVLVPYGDTAALASAVAARVLDDRELAKRLIAAGPRAGCGWADLSAAVDQVEGDLRRAGLRG